MQGPSLLLVLVVGVQAVSSYGVLEEVRTSRQSEHRRIRQVGDEEEVRKGDVKDLQGTADIELGRHREEVQVSSQSVKVFASPEYPGQEAEVRPLPRKLRQVSGKQKQADVVHLKKRDIKDLHRTASIDGVRYMEEVQVSSQPLKVSAPSEYLGQKADVRRLPRSVRQTSSEDEIVNFGHERKNENKIPEESPGQKGEMEDPGRGPSSERERHSEKIQSSPQPLGALVSPGNPKEETEARPLSTGIHQLSGNEESPGTENKRKNDVEYTKPKESKALSAKGKGDNEHLEGNVPSMEGRRLIEEETGRGHMKKMKKSFKKIMPYLLVPGMMALGYAPFILASLKMFVMNAVMINMMAFNAAIFITLRNMVFGPRVGQHVKYYNFGYSHRKKPHHHHHHH